MAIKPTTQQKHSNSDTVIQTNHPAKQLWLVSQSCLGSIIEANDEAESLADTLVSDNVV